MNNIEESLYLCWSKCKKIWQSKYQCLIFSLIAFANLFVSQYLEFSAFRELKIKKLCQCLAERDCFWSQTVPRFFKILYKINYALWVVLNFASWCETRLSFCINSWYFLSSAKVIGSFLSSSYLLSVLVVHSSLKAGRLYR